MSLAFLDENYREKVREFCQFVVAIPLGEGDSSAREDGYIKFLHGPTWAARGHREPNIPWTRGMEAKVLEVEIDRRMDELAQEAGKVWVEAYYTSESNPFKHFYVRCRPTADGGLDVGGLALSKGGGHALMGAAAQVIVALSNDRGRTADLNIRLCESLEQVAFKLGATMTELEHVKAEGTSRAIEAAVEAMGKTFNGVGVELVREIVGPLFRARFVGAGAGGDDDEELLEQPKEPGEERLNWHLDLIERCALGAFADINALNGEVPAGAKARIESLAAKLQMAIQVLNASADAGDVDDDDGAEATP